MKKIIWAFIMAIAFLIMAALAFVAIVGLRVQRVKLPELLGNSPENIRYLTATTNPDDFTFLVVGDIRRASETFEEMVDLVRGDKPAFMVILGDLVTDPDFPQHKLFMFEINEESLPFPVFLIPGNHDVSPDGPFKIEDFEAFYGPAQFHFSIGKRLFVFVNNAPPYDDDREYLRYLQRVLSEKAKGAQDIFVFMHSPPLELSPSLLASGLHGAGEFMDLAKKYRVRYVFAADHHGYWKGERDGTTYIVTGGGGAKLRGEHGRFYHMVRMSVENGSVTETVIVSKHYSEGWDLIERNIVVYIWPFMFGNGASTAATLLIFIAAVLLLLFSLGRVRRPRK